MKNECKLGGHGPRFMPATPIFQKHCFFKNGLKMLTKVENFNFFFAFLVKIFIGHFNGTFSNSLEIEGNVRAVKFHSNRTVIKKQPEYGFECPYL